VLAVAIVALAAPAALAGNLEKADPEIKFWAANRTLYDSGQNYLDLEDSGDPGGNDDYAWFRTRTMLGMKAKLARNVTASFALQNVSVFGNQSATRSMTTMDGHPYFSNLDGTESETEIYTARMTLDRLFGSGFGAAVGRGEYKVGGNLIFGNDHFYSGNVFDGLIGWYEWDSWTLRGSYFITEERNDPSSAFFAGDANNPAPGDEGFGNEDATVLGLDATFNLGGENGNWGDLDVYTYCMYDGLEANLHEQMMIFGGQWARKVKTVEKAEANPWAWNIELAIEDGEFGEQDPDPNNPGLTGDTFDFSGWIMEGELGYNFIQNGHILHKPRIGFIAVPGDDDMTDDDFTGYRAWYGDIHCRFGCADLFGASPFSGGFGTGFATEFDNAGFLGTNIGYTGMTNPGRHAWWVTYWNFAPMEDEVEGPGGKVDIEDFGTEIDLGYSYGYSENVRMFFSVAQLSPDDGLSDWYGTTQDDAITRMYGGLFMKFH
jgi:hypothetical protein